MSEFWCERAWLSGSCVSGVLVRCVDGLITEVSSGVEPPPGVHRLAGVVFPGFANVHSHAFHRALRGRTHADGGTFWTWRDAMYRLSARLDPDSYYRLARLVYAEMALAGFTCVGEFHYLHHAPGGARYADPNAMGTALIAAARDVGIRITLLDTCYLAGGLDGSGYLPLAEPQLRFGDGDVAGWLARVADLRPSSGAVIGKALHSVRAVPELPSVSGLVHVHLSEQPAENEACQAFHGCSPTELLASAGLLRPDVTAVHATHLSDVDISLLGSAGVTACFCPTTEADLADGIGPARELADAGCPIALGTDQHAVVDALAEARALEHGERLRSGSRGRFTPAELVDCLTRHHALGWDAGRIAVGARADLVSVRLDSPRTAGASPDQVVLAATASDVDTVVVGGQVVVNEGRHEIGSVGGALSDVIEELWR
ncbi:MAG TPA: formimidoylglutamate deiminase [Pseudonocardiaceae bacterium]|nr:formimidoylglutamate deiminase [Pseudonocardiaceae bacterium]